MNQSGESTTVSICKYWNEAVDFFGNYSVDQRTFFLGEFLEMSEGAPKTLSPG
jgi:hypothetical protein